MKWFEGDIAEAITLTKQRNAVFVVFIYGNDEASTSTLEAINSTEVSNKLSTDEFVVVKLESGSQPYHQFVQIYQLVPVPSLFFIGQSGVPLEVVPGKATSSDLVERINKMTSTNNAQQANDSVPANKSSPVESDARSQPEMSPPVREATPPAAAEASEQSEQTLQERIKKAEQVRLALAAKKQREEEEHERERELVRRREGQELTQARRSRETLEAQQAAEERRREREMEREAREKVLKQIEQDKLERAARFAAEKSVSPAPVTVPPVTTAAPSVATTARLQFRLPDGSSQTQVFEPESSLREVRQYVYTNLHPASFSLSMAFPRAELSTEDDASSLRDLGLVPSAALLVLPAGSTVPGVVSSTGSGLIGLLWLLLSPITFVWTFISARFWGSSNNPPPVSEDRSGPGAAGAAAQARANQGDLRQRVRREGNIHRLAGAQDSDDDNNTYNGNSTQQM